MLGSRSNGSLLVRRMARYLCTRWECEGKFNSESVRNILTNCLSYETDDTKWKKVLNSGKLI